MRIFDVLLAILLTGGMALTLPIWWWLFAEPILRFGKVLAVNDNPRRRKNTRPFPNSCLPKPTSKEGA